MQRLFVYGTLQVPAVIGRIVPRTLPAEPATLHGYRRGRVARADFPGIVPKADCSVQGQLLKQLQPEDLVLLDRYEGELYHRVMVEVVTEQATKVKCWVYVMARWASDRVLDEDWELGGYRAGHVRWTYRD